ncbi:MAG: tRNA preQ1(34) S-adenosylmethionine ribosyltransferase-isomerase QueA [Candidatus Omnitrophica bacterium]|nr:tRNA preQ1(34) S-adenosylmethionine ribosyltransferase-isomerase QueA [Candidatus Omnitrophota bacterium]
MRLSEFNYDLPKELIAKYPLKEREKCRLMVLDREKRSISHKTFEDIAGYFNKGDLLVLNDTKVIPARLFGRRKTGGKVELFLLEKKNPTCEALVRPSGRLKEGEKVTLESGAEAEVLGRGEVGRFVKFNRPIDEILASGHVPLPPYIDRLDEPDDRGSYQTVYADKEGATASPTAGLHFTRKLLSRIASCVVRIAYVTLHTNYGTFAPIKTENVESHKMHKEYFELPAETINTILETKKNGGKVFAVGTTTTRVLEYCADKITHDAIRTTQYERGYTDMYIYPGYKFKAVDHLITNFHLPKSTLMLLVSAFAGKDFIFEAYRQAIEEKYRFFSYGDAMLIL